MSRIVWRKSSRSGDGPNCVEVGVWNKSSLSSNGPDCVEVALADASHPGTDPTPDADRLFLVRDSKDPDGPVLSFTPAEWDAFLATVKDGTLTTDRVL
ncbi:DUF397 domain-containing protein [Streptosporangium sp. NBC_01756]|uniref:DUF397 domain-containing protein n=1 Tax=Streptosporangium sp. NBC_01756 TaxID=2975950 RepID=UPI002DD837D8|nr:DUF397 domain-containing protein [Streptosporangium sp. NBC_01756]